MFLSLHPVRKIRRDHGRTVDALAIKHDSLAKCVGGLLLNNEWVLLAVWVATIIFWLLSEFLPVEQTPLYTGEE